ncbi:MAG: fibronectin type III domain-containing protein, partial [Chitinophagales bacterium]|nr:fibronectin type III domain-containing protein [Chitinophagales bacterium]
MKHVFTKCSVFFAIFSFVAILFTNELHATTCASATVINPASIPISGQSLVCGATNDLTYAGAAGSIKVAPCSSTSSYGGGQEALYVFTPTVTQTYTISISGQTWTSIMVTLGCPTTAGSTCVAAAASSASSKSVNAALTAGQTYYIWFDTWPTPNSPCPGTFSIAPLYVPCSNITNISACGVTASTTWVAGSSSTYNPPATSCGFATPGQERIYSFTPTITGIHQINITAITGGYYDFFLKAASGGCNGTGWTCLGDRNATGTFGTLNLTAGTQYYIMLDPEQTGAGSMSFEILCPALCGNITLGTPTPITANSGTLNWTAGLPTPADYQIEYGEALYSFTGTPQITTTSGATSFNLTGLTGNTYYQYRIRSVCPGPQYGNWSSTGVFVTTMTNDDCAGAIALSSCTGSPKTKSGTTTGSTVDAIYSNCGAGGSGTTERGVWYTYAGDDNAVTMTTCDPSGIGYDSRITVYSGSCGALTCVTSNDDMTPGCATGSFRSLVNFNAFAGTTYYIFVHGFQSGAGLSAQGDFILNYSCSALCLPIPPNETCGTATSYTLSTSYTPTTASNNCANADFVTNPTCFSAFATLPDLWYQFTTPPAITTAKIRIDLNGSATGMGYALFSGTCGTLTQIACNSGVTSGTTYDLTGLTGSTTYRIAILGPNGSRGSFDFGLWYESCPAPTALGASGITFNSANLNWTSNAPSSFFDIYYGVSPLAVPNGATTPTVNDYNGGAGGSITYPLGGLNNTTTYQYYVREDCGAGDVSSWSGPFTFSTLAVPPANDDCSGAIALTPCAAPVQAIGLSGATESLTAPFDCGGNANDDVWYSFVANSATMYITVQCFGGYDAVVEGRVGPGCNGTYLGCVDNTLDDEFEDVVLTGATIGETYYIRVYDWYSATLPPTAGFNITVAPAGCWQGWNNTAWNDGGNWSNLIVPTVCADNVTIPGGLTNYPVVNIVSATAGSVDIQSGASLTINTGNTLNVCGDFINYGTPNIGDGTLNFTSTANQGHIGNTVANFVSVNKTAGVVDIQDGAIDVNTAVQLQSGTLSTLLGGSLRLLSNAPNHAAIIDNFSPTFSGTLTGPITAQRYISGAGNVQHQMGLPVAANLGQIGAGASSGYVIPQPTCDETESASNSPYGNVFRWDESNPTTCILQGWNVMNSGTANESGRGYSTYQTGGNVIEVTGAPNLAGSYTKTGLANSNYNLPTLQSSGSYTFNSGWHLLANPYPSGYTYTAQAGFGAVGSVYVPSGPYSGTYQPLNNGDQLAPFQGFMVFKTPGAPAT